MFCRNGDHVHLRLGRCYCPNCWAYQWFHRALRRFSSNSLEEMYRTIPSGPVHKHLRVAIVDAKTQVECPF